MKGSKQFNRRMLSAACSMALALTASGIAFAQEDIPYEQDALKIVAKRLGVEADTLSLQNASAGRLELQDLVFYGYKIADKDGTVHTVSLDGKGAEVDYEASLKKEQALQSGRYGKLDRRLADAIAGIDPRTPVTVTLWLRQSREPSLARPAADEKLSDEDVDRLYADLDGQRSEIAKQDADAVIARLEKEGLKGTRDADTASIAVDIPAGDMRRIGDWDEVSAVYLDDRNQNDLAIAGNSIRAYNVHATGNTGQSVRVAAVEVGGLFNTGNPYLAGVAQFAPFACYNNHGTNVAGVIRSTHSVQRGISPGVALFVGGSCGGNSSQLRFVSSVAAGWGARAQNLSWGADTGRVPGANDRYYDDLVQNGWRTIVVSAGNNNPPYGSGTGNVGSPGLAYNTITVGAFNDRSSSWSMSTFSSWRDPLSVHGDREKPEVVAPGTNIQTTSGNGLGSNSGTSFSAPMVTATSALMMRTNPALSVWPEAVKSILMATATSNIEGGTIWSEYDGAGGINAERANRVSGYSGGTWGAQSYSCGAASQSVVSNVFLKAGQRTRVAMAWDTNPMFLNFFYGFMPSADLDMQIVGPANNVVAGSYSWDNTYEIVEFVAPSSGTYRLRVNKFRCTLTPKWLGWAWYTG